jgi:hypothetical protein
MHSFEAMCRRNFERNNRGYVKKRMMHWKFREGCITGKPLTRLLNRPSSMGIVWFAEDVDVVMQAKR